MSCRPFLSASLAALVALSACLPCYTLAYADEGLEVSNEVLSEEHPEAERARSDRGGASAEDDSGQPPVDAADEGAAGGGVEDYGEGPGEAEAFAPADGGLAQSDEVSAEDSIAPYAVQFSVIDTLMGTAWSGEGTQFTIGSNKISAKNGTIIWAVLAAADVLEYVSEQLKAIDSDMLGALTYIQSQLKSIATSNQGYVNSIVGLSQSQWGYWVGDAYIVKANSPAERLGALLETTNYLSAQLKTVGGTVSYISDQIKSVASMMPQGSTVVYISDQIKALGGYVTSNGAKVDAVFDELNYISEQIKSIGALMPYGSDVSYMREQLKSIGGYIVSNGNFLEDIFLALQSDTGISRLLAAWASRWDVQDRVMMEWASRWDVLDRMLVEWGKSWESFRDDLLEGIGGIGVVSPSVDLGLIEADLGTIKMLLMGQTAADIVDLLVGEVDLPMVNSSFTVVKGAMSSAFPFNIPALLSQMLGLMQSDAQIPRFEFDIWGSALVIDLSDMEGFARITRWSSCAMLALALLANTKRFIVNMGGSD